MARQRNQHDIERTQRGGIGNDADVCLALERPLVSKTPAPVCHTLHERLRAFSGGRPQRHRRAVVRQVSGCCATYGARADDGNRFCHGRYSTLTPAALTTPAQRATSSRTMRVKGSPETPAISAPSVASRERTSASCSALPHSAATRATTGAGVPAGINTPFHEETVNPAIDCSVNVGTSGSWRAFG